MTWIREHVHETPEHDRKITEKKTKWYCHYLALVFSLSRAILSLSLFSFPRVNFVVFSLPCGTRCHKPPYKLLITKELFGDWLNTDPLQCLFHSPLRHLSTLQGVFQVNRILQVWMANSYMEFWLMSQIVNYGHPFNTRNRRGFNRYHFKCMDTTHIRLRSGEDELGHSWQYVLINRIITYLWSWYWVTIRFKKQMILDPKKVFVIVCYMILGETNLVVKSTK